MEDREQNLQREVILKVLWSTKVFVPLQTKLYVVDDKDNEISISSDQW